jgi:hypothetical protein
MHASKRSGVKKGRLPVGVRIEGLESRELLTASFSVSSVITPGSTPTTPGFDAGVAVTTVGSGTSAVTYVVGVYTNPEAGEAVSATKFGDLNLNKANTSPTVNSPGVLSTIKTAGAIAQGGLNCFVAKYNASGGFVWATEFYELGKGGFEPQNQIGAITVAGGNVYVTGQAMDPMQFGPKSNTLNAPSQAKYTCSDGGIYTVSLNATSGNVNWVATLDGFGFGRAIATNAAGDVFIGGEFQFAFGAELSGTTVPFTEVDSQGSQDAFVAEYSPSGGLLKFTPYSAGSNSGNQSEIRDMTMVGTNLYIAGDFNGALFGVTANAGSDGFLQDLSLGSNPSPTVAAPLTPIGKPLIVAGVGGNAGALDQIRTIAVSSGNIYIGGRFAANATVQSGTQALSVPVALTTSTTIAATGGTAGYVLEVNGSTVLHDWMLGGAAKGGHAQVNAIDVDSSGKVYATGSYNGKFATSFGTVITTSDDLYVAELTNTLTVAKFSPYSDPNNSGNDSGNGIAVSSTGNVDVVGVFNGQINFGPFTVTSNVDDPIHGTDDDPTPPKKAGFGGFFLISLLE